MNRIGFLRGHETCSAPAEQILSLVCHFPKIVREQRNIVIIHAYIDDSGNSEPPLYVLAGFINRVNSWIKFTDEWQSVLDVSPRLEYFKMQEANSLEGQFAHWSASRRDERVNALIDVITNNKPQAVCSVINYENCQRHFNGHPWGQYSIPHFLNIHSLMAGIASQFAAKQPGSKTTFVFDKSILKGHIKKTLDFVWENVPAVLKPFIEWPPTEKDDVDVLPLQAADMLAWKIRRDYYDESYMNQALRWRWKSLDSIPTLVTGWTDEQLSNAANGRAVGPIK